MGTFNAGAIEASLTLGRSSWEKDLKKTQREIADLEKTTVTIGIDADTDNARIQMDNLELLLDDLDQQTYTPSVDLITRDAEEALAKLRAQLDALDARTVTVMVDADTDNAFVQFSLVEDEMNLLDKDPVNIMVDADSERARLKLEELETLVELLSRNQVDIQAEADTIGAEAQLAALEATVIGLDGSTIHIDTDYDKDTMSSLVGDGEGGGGGGHLGLLKILLIAIIALAPILGVATGAALAGVVALAGALAAAAIPAVLLAGGIALLISAFNKAKKDGNLTPEMEALQTALTNLNKVLDTVKEGIGKVGFEVMADALNLLADILPPLIPLFNAVAVAIDTFLIQPIQEFVDSPGYKEMIDFFMGFGINMLIHFINILGNLGSFFGNLIKAMAPFIEQFMQGFEDLTGAWAQWARELDSNKGFQHFLDNALKYGPMVLHMLSSMLDAFIAIGHALEPFAGPMIEGLTMFFDAIANAPTPILTIVIGLLAGLYVTVQVLLPLVLGLSTAVEILGGVLAVAFSPIGAIIVAIVALVGIIIYLWQTNEAFRDAVIDTWNTIVENLKPIIDDIVGYIKDNWGPIKEWFLETWGDITDAVSQYVQLILAVVRIMVIGIKAIWDGFGPQIIQAVTGVFQIVAGVIKGFFQIIAGIFQVFRGILTGNWQAVWDGLVKIVHGFGSIIGGVIRGIGNIIGAGIAAVGKIIAAQFGAGWNAAKQKFTDFKNWINGRISALGSWIKGIRFDPGAMFDSIKGAFKNAINAVISWWNGLHFSVPGFDPPGPGPKIPGFSIGTPNIPHLAAGAVVDAATLALIGEGGNREIVAPEPVLKQIVQENSGGNIDYGRLAAAVAAAISPILARIPGVSKEDLQRLIEAASINLNFDVRGEDANTAEKFASTVLYSLRVAGFGGVYSG